MGSTSFLIRSVYTLRLLGSASFFVCLIIFQGLASSLIRSVNNQGKFPCLFGNYSEVCGFGEFPWSFSNYPRLVRLISATYKNWGTSQMYSLHCECTPFGRCFCSLLKTPTHRGACRYLYTFACPFYKLIVTYVHESTASFFLRSVDNFIVKEIVD